MTFDGFNELDSFIASAILNRIKLPGWTAEITSPTDSVTSMNGVCVESQKPLSFANEADVVLFGSGVKTKDLVQDESIISQLKLSPERQLIGSQCSGVLFLHKLELLHHSPVCTDSKTRPYLEELGVTVEDRPFIESGNIATAGGCLASQYLAMWVIYRAIGLEAAKEIIHYVAPVGQKDEYLSRAINTVVNAQGEIP